MVWVESYVMLFCSQKLFGTLFFFFKTLYRTNNKPHQKMYLTTLWLCFTHMKYYSIRLLFLTNFSAKCCSAICKNEIYILSW